MSDAAAGAASRVLFTAWPFPGHLFPLIAVAHALRRRGHEVAFYTGADSAEIVRGEGFECFSFRRVDEAAIDGLMRGRPAEPWRLTRLPRLAVLLRRWLLETVPQQIDDLEDVMRRWAPTVIATEPTLWAPILVLGEKHHVPVAVCSFVPAWMVPGRDEAPFGPGRPRPRHWPARLAARMLTRLTRLASRISVRGANAIRASHGLPRLTAGSVTEHTAAMPLYLVPSAPDFDRNRRDLPPSVHYVGPLLWNRPRTEPPFALADRAASDSPCVHVTEGTVHVHHPFLLQAATRALGGLPMRVIATTGGNRSIDMLNLGELPSNVRIERWLSHQDLLPFVDLVVTTGGAGSVLAALAAGVPLVIVPTEWDKPEIAQRVVEAGAGVRLAPQHCTPARLRACVLEVLQNPRYRAAARRLSGIFARQGGPERAAELLVALDRAPIARAGAAAQRAAAPVAASQGA
jgi:MGT family glycosyltransferase